MDTAAQICADACAIAKANGFKSQAGRYLQATLNDLALHRNLKQNLTSTPVVLAANSNGPFALPQNYLRPYDFYYSVNGEPYEITERTLEQYDAYFKDPSVANYPAIFATDLSGLAAEPATPPLMYVYPQSNLGVTATLRYFVNQTELTPPLENSTVVPWFVDQQYLVNDVARQLMRITDDERFASWDGPDGVCERQLRKHLLMEGDEQRVVHSIKLDPVRFRMGKNIKPTKATVF